MPRCDRTSRRPSPSSRGSCLAPVIELARTVSGGRRTTRCARRKLRAVGTRRARRSESLRLTSSTKLAQRASSSPSPIEPRSATWIGTTPCMPPAHRSDATSRRPDWTHARRDFSRHRPSLNATAPLCRHRRRGTLRSRRVGEAPTEPHRPRHDANRPRTGIDATPCSSQRQLFLMHEAPRRAPSRTGTGGW